VAFPQRLEVVRDPRSATAWTTVVDGRRVTLSNLDKPYWAPEGYTKADLVAYYANIAPWALPYVRDRPLTMKRMPGGADGEFFYAKQVPEHAPDWVSTAAVTSIGGGKTIDYVLGQDAATLLWLANLGCVELHPWHARVDDLAHPDYAFFDLDPNLDADVDFATVREVALLVRDACEHLGLRSYPRTSGASGMQVYVPIDRVHTAGAVTEWVGRVCAAIHRADPERTTMVWQVADRPAAVFLDHRMNTEGRNIAGTYSLRPERDATLAAPLIWDEVEGGAVPQDFTIASIWARLDAVGDLFAPVLAGGQDLRAAMRAVGMDPDDQRAASHSVTSTTARPGPTSARQAPASSRLETYARKRDFAVTSEPSPQSAGLGEDPGGPRFVLQHHLATRLHHDLRLAHGGVAVSWAVPKGLPDVPGVRHLAVQTEDHPLSYMGFEGDIPSGEYGGGPVRIWDEGTYELLEWEDGAVKFRLRGARHRGEYHLFATNTDWLVVRADEPAPGELPEAPPELVPMLASSASAAFDDPEWVFEVKWDGVRAITTVVRPGRGEDGSTRLVSRLGNDISGGYPELAEVWQRVLARNAVIDGEIVAFDEAGNPSFQRLQRRMHLRGGADVQRARRRNPVTLVALDLLAVDGLALTDLALSERLERLDALVVPGVALRISERFPEDGRALYAAAEQRGLEGIMAKRLSSRYRPGARSRDWRKLKVRRRTEVIVAGWLPGDAGRSGDLGALLACWHEADGGLVYAGRVGTGFDAAERRRLLDRLADLGPSAQPPADAPRLPQARWVEPALVCAVEYGELTDAGRLRAPSYKGLVAVDPGTCTRPERRPADG
jgi:bifunctional non-homologous end joining protein LigD